MRWRPQHERMENYSSCDWRIFSCWVFSPTPSDGGWVWVLMEKAGMNTPTINSEKRQKQAEIERKTAEFLAKGGNIDREQLRKTKHVDVHFRYYSGTEKKAAA